MLLQVIAAGRLLMIVINQLSVTTPLFSARQEARVKIDKAP